MNTQQAAALTSYSAKALETMRAKGIGPSYIKIGTSKNGVIRYKLEDIRTWLDSHKEETQDVK